MRRKITIKFKHNLMLINLKGNISLSEVDWLGKEAFPPGQPVPFNVILNLKAVTEMEEMVARALTALLDRVRQRNKSIHLVGVNEVIRDPLQRAGALEKFKVYKTMRQARRGSKIRVFSPRP